jgi:signal transduction histidine kinase/DNA-binding response OmpR family regulator
MLALAVLLFRAATTGGAKMDAGSQSKSAANDARSRGESLQFEMCLSPHWVTGALLALGVALFVASQLLPGLPDRLVGQDLALLLTVASGLIWTLSLWRPLAGRWAIPVTLLIAIALSSRWLQTPGPLVLLPVPVSLSAALIGLPATGLVAVLASATLLWVQPDAMPDTLLAIALLLAIWATAGTMVAIYGPVHRVMRWAWQGYERTQRALEQARQRQVELRQALEDLAQANLQLTRLNVVAQRLRQAAEDARTAKEQFVANVSHELRTPLNMIVGFSEMILQAPQAYGDRLPPALLADLSVIRRNAEHLAELIDDVLDLSQIEAGQMALTKEHVHFAEVVQAAVVAVRPLFESKGLTLETDLPEDLPDVFCDRTRIREVLLNLLSNAGRFTERGGVRLCVSVREENLWVSVADTGPGIAADGVRKLFEPFQQADGSIRRRYGGTGLGLSISKGFIEMHGGEIGVESKESVGTTFTFCLPLVSATPAGGDFSRWLVPDWEYLQRTRPSAAPKTVVRPRLVICEEGRALQRLLSRYLDGAEIVPAETWEDALEELASTPSQALLLNELSLAGTMARLKSTSLPHDTPVLVCSVPGIDRAADALGVSDYLVKPISRDALLAALDDLETSELEGIPTHAGPAKTGHKTILIVDDEPEALRLFRRMLDSSGRNYRVLRARDGQRALHLLRQHQPDIVLLDLVMPNMDGFELLEAKRRDPALRDIPTIVISARDPAGQPIVSNALTVTRENGLSARQLVTCIKSLSELFAPTDPLADRAPTAAPVG